MKDIFHSFWRAYILMKTKNLIKKVADTSFKHDFLLFWMDYFDLHPRGVVELLINKFSWFTIFHTFFINYLADPRPTLGHAPLAQCLSMRFISFDPRANGSLVPRLGAQAKARPWASARIKPGTVPSRVDALSPCTCLTKEVELF